MSTAAAAATAIAAAVPKPAVIPPASPFAELLRRSRFASYDPAIRQTYSSPSAHAHRGDWGLKRPIALRRRNAFISLASFESPAQFTEWNHAENQVRFIRRVEEMGVTPRTAPNSSWYHGLGKAKTEWLIDSDFCPGETHVFRPPEENQTRIDLADLGNKGSGRYGANRPLQKDDAQQLSTHVIPNIDAMSRQQFQKYLSKLRELRPKFQEYLQTQKKPITKSLYELAQDSTSDYHTKFLLSHTAQGFQDRSSRQIEQQPHPNGGLMYACPSRLDTHFTTETQPGIVLQSEEYSHRHGRYSRPEDKYVVSFGGLSATVSKKNAAGKLPLFDRGSDHGIDPSKLPDSVGYMRVRNLELVDAPRVVDRRAQGLKAVRVKADVAVESSHPEFGIENPHEPGTPEYIAAEARNARSRPSDFSRRNVKFSTVDPKQWSRMRTETREKSKQVLSTLEEMMNGGGKGKKS